MYVRISKYDPPELPLDSLCTESDHIIVRELALTPADKTMLQEPDASKGIRSSATVIPEHAIGGLDGLFNEAGFSDLLMLCKGHLFSGNPDVPARLFETLLKRIFSPFLLLPSRPFSPDQLLLAFDSTDLSLYAFRQFSYLFPHLLMNRPVKIVFTGQREDEFMKNYDLLEALIGQYTQDMSILKLDFNEKNYFSIKIEEMDAPLLITGTYGRNILPAFLERSFVADVLKENKIPVFIAHV